MRRVAWEDDRGYLRVALVRDADPDEAGPEGIPLEPPDLGEIDWKDIERELHNALVQEGLFTWTDVLAAQEALGSAACRIVRRRVAQLYKQKEREVKNGKYLYPD